MCNIYNEETAFYSWKKVFFFASWYWHVHRFFCFRKEEDQNVQHDSCRSSMFKEDEEKKLIVPFIKFKSTKKDKILLECVVSTSTAKHILKGVLVTKGKLKSDVNTISDLIRVEKYVDNNIQIFSSLMRSDMKNINRKVLWRFCMGRMFETLRQEKKFKMVLFGLSENNCHDYWFGSMWEIFKMKSFKLYIP